MLRFVLIFLLSSSTVNGTMAQHYITAMGIRMGTEMGITLQQRILPRTTIEGIFSTSAATALSMGTVLVQLHNPLISKRFNIYVGGGFHNRWLRGEEQARLTRRGVTGVAGAELTLGRINISWDFKPVYHLNVSQDQYETETAISLRYVFIKKLKGPKKSAGIFSKKRSKGKRQRLKARKKKQRKKMQKRKSKKSKRSM